MTADLFDHHRRLLDERAISDQVADARGYESTAVPGGLRGQGFSRAVADLVPGLVIPIHDIHGDRRFVQYRPDNPRVLDGKRRKYEIPARTRLVLDVPPQIRGKLHSPARPLWVTEGPMKADAAVSAGLTCIATFGVWGWRGTNHRGGKTALPDWESIALAGRDVYLVPDSDVMSNPMVADAVSRLGRWLASRDANVRYVCLPTAADGGKTGLDDYLARVGDVDGLLKLADDEPPRADAVQGDTHITGKPLSKPLPAVPPMTMAQVEAAYARYLHDEDTVTTRVVHAAYVANMVLDGDPVWVFLIGGSGQGKTERLMPLAPMPPVVLTSTLGGEAALLSATARRDRAENATGGLLRQLGDRGLLVIKDFTSILEMDRHDRGKILAALREVYDGRWDRPVGTEGGLTLTWKGKCGLLAASTTAIDRAHAVMNEMGPRSLFVRLPPADQAKLGKSALSHMGRETLMRADLAAATAGLLTHLPGQAHEITEPVETGLIGLAALAALARSPVHRDWKGEIELVGDAEAPTRIIKQLGQLWRACGMIGLAVPESWEVVTRCALDSIPKLRGAVIRHLASLDTDLSGIPKPATTTEVRIALSHPHRTTLRALEDLAAHGVVTRTSAGQGHADGWALSPDAQSWITGYEGLPVMWVSPRTASAHDGAEADEPDEPDDADDKWQPDDPGWEPPF